MDANFHPLYRPRWIGAIKYQDDKDANLKKHISGATTTNDNPETYDYTRIYNHTHSYDIIFHNFRNSSTINFKLNLK